MRIGACAWNFNSGSYAAPYEDAISAMAEVGFEGAELMIFSPDDLENYYTNERTQALFHLIDRKGIAISQISVYDHVLRGLASFDKREKQRAFDNFRRCCDIASSMKAPGLNTVSQWPQVLTGPTNYPPSVIYNDMRGMEKLSPKLTLSLPRQWSWEREWDNYVESWRVCLEIARQHQLYFAIEGHCHVLVSGTDSALRFIDHLDNDPNIGVNLDTGWHMRQREYLPMSIYKLGNRLKHIHARDTDGLLNYNLPPGQGIIDWHHVIQALADIHYDGFLTIELANLEQPERPFGEAKRYLQEAFATGASS